MPVFPIKPSFARGEISPRLWARADISHYPLALKECLNFTVLRQGGLTRRTGTQFIHEVKDSSRKTRLIPFIFSTEQAYILEFGHLYMRVYALGGIVESGGTPVEIATPYTESQIFDLHYAQSADVLYVAHRSHAPRKISRTSDTNWTIGQVEFKDGPYLEINDSETTLKPAQRGSLTPVMTGNTAPSGTASDSNGSADAYKVFDGNTASADVLNGLTGWVAYDLPASNEAVVDAYWVGADDGTPTRTPSNWVVEGFDGTNWIVLDSRTAQTGWTGGEKRFFEFSNKTAFQSYRLRWMAASGSGSTSGPGEIGFNRAGDDQTPFNLTASSTAGINDGQGFLATDVGRMIRLLGGDGKWRWARIVSRTSSTVVTIRLYGHALPDTSPIANWQLGAFSASTGWPARVGFYQERLVWARSDAQPQTVWMSKAGELEDYGTSQPIQADDGLTLTILSDSVNEIKWIKEGTNLLIGTSGGIRSIGPGDASNVFAADNVLQRKHVNYGAADKQPIEVGQVTLYLDRFRKGVREAMYSFENDAIVAPEVTVLSEHIFAHGIADMARQALPLSVVWLALENGELAGITYEREQEMFATHRHRIGGRAGASDYGHVESVACIPGDTGDELWMIVRRTINGQTKRYVERLSAEFNGDVQDAFFVDSGLTYNGSPTNTFTGLDHLEGEEVAILGDGAVFPSETVVGGQVSLQGGEEVSKASIGLAYHSQMHTLDPGVSRGDGTGLGRRKKIVQVMVDLMDTGQLMGRTAASDKAEIIVLRSTSDEMDKAIPLASGWHRFRPDGRWGDAPGEVVLFANTPLPATIRAVTPVIEPEP